MKRNSSYKTKQREFILEYLKKHKDEHISVEDILYHLKQSGTPVGTSTVYRYLDKLVKENIVRKYQTEEGKSACYQYSGDGVCKTHYHFKCIDCGTLFHVDCEVFHDIEEHLKKEHKFYLDSCKTVLYGLCQSCKKEEKKAKNYE